MPASALSVAARLRLPTFLRYRHIISCVVQSNVVQGSSYPAQQHADRSQRRKVPQPSCHGLASPSGHPHHSVSIEAGTPAPTERSTLPYLRCRCEQYWRMSQVLRRAAAALQARFLPKLVQQGDVPLFLKVQDSTARSFTTFSVICQGPATAIEITQEQLAQIRHRVFGTHIGNGLPSGRKLLQKKLIGEKVASYYEHGEPLKDPLVINLDAERSEINS